MGQLKQYNFYYLLAGLLFLLLFTPLLKDLTGKNYHHISEFTFSFFLLIGIWSLYKTPRLFLFGTALTLLGITGNVLAFINADDAPIYIFLSLSSYILFVLLSIILAIQYLLRLEAVNANGIIGAVCVYLLFGVIWSLIYTLLNLFIPNSFDGNISDRFSEQLQDFLHFSFVTLTTLGYGDITPIRPTARALSTIEAILGQFYIATLVAGLVAVFITQKK